MVELLLDLAPVGLETGGGAEDGVEGEQADVVGHVEGVAPCELGLETPERYEFAGDVVDVRGVDLGSTYSSAMVARHGGRAGLGAV